MEFFKPNTKIDFLGVRLWAAAFSIIVLLVSFVSFFYHGLNLGLDFTGGTQIELSFAQPVNVNQIRDELQQAKFIDYQVQNFGDSRDIVVTLGIDNSARIQTSDPKKVQDILVSSVLKVIPDATLNSASFVGGKVSVELAYKGTLAIVIALLATMIYIAFRFEWRLAVGAAVALIHDPVFILGVFSFFRIQFDLTALAAVLTILGYSLHDTIVVFDRVRENFRKMRHGSSQDIVNAAINQTLSRTVISSGLTLIVVAILFWLGGPTIHAFSMALIIGIIIGTYSSIYVAGSLAVSLGLSRANLLTIVKKEYDDLP